LKGTTTMDVNHLDDYRSDRRVFLSCVRRRKRIEQGAPGNWGATRRMEGEALHGALSARLALGLTKLHPDRIIIP
jgi:hypothetical protein